MPFNKHFPECPDCGHANRQCDCACTNPRGICCKKNRGQWNGLGQVNGGLSYTGRDTDRDRERGS